MPTSPNLGIVHVATNQHQKEPTMNEAIDILDDSANTVRTIATGDADVTLTAMQQNRSGRLKFTGALTADRDVVLLGSAKLLVIENACTGGFALNVTHGMSPGAIGAVVSQDEICTVHADGTEVRKSGSNLDTMSGMIEVVGAKTYVLDQSAPFEYDILKLTGQTASGDVTISIQIAGIDVTGLNGLAEGVTELASDATAARRVAIGDRVTMVATGVGSPTPIDFAFTIIRAKP